MAVFRSISLASVTVLLAHLNGVQATTFLAPEQDIVLPASGSAREPLEWAGANSPYFAGEFSSSQASEALQDWGG
jgi:hypothetical protein